MNYVKQGRPDRINNKLRGIVVLGYQAESGKDESAKMIKERLESLGYTVGIMHYAYYIKDIAKRFLGWDGQKDESGRNFLQQLGTDEIRGRLGWNEFHCNRVCEDIQIVRDYYDYILIPDGRFINEIYFTKAKFPYQNVISVHVDRTDYFLNKDLGGHKSERELDGFKFDWTIHNSKGLDHLKNQCDFFVTEVLLNNYIDQE